MPNLHVCIFVQASNIIKHRRVWKVQTPSLWPRCVETYEEIRSKFIKLLSAQSPDLQGKLMNHAKRLIFQSPMGKMLWSDGALILGSKIHFATNCASQAATVTQNWNWSSWDSVSVCIPTKALQPDPLYFPSFPAWTVCYEVQTQNVLWLSCLSVLWMVF